MPTPSPDLIHSTTQQFLEIFDITNDLAIMKDGTTSMILTVDAMNFGLLAEEEQDAIMYAYAGLLNSLNYPIQIVIRSQTKDATNYLNLLKEQEAKASSETKQQFIKEYREFVGDLIRERNVLDKKFYIVITATSLEMGLLPPQTVVPGVKQIDISSIEKSSILEKAITILEPRRDHLASQFGRIGLYARQLQTQEIIQLFYTSYNPEAVEGQQITNTQDYITPLVSAQGLTTPPPESLGTYEPSAQPYPGATQPYPTSPPAQMNYINPTDQNQDLLATNTTYQQSPTITTIPMTPDEVLAQSTSVPTEVAPPPPTVLPPSPQPVAFSNNSVVDAAQIGAPPTP